MRLALTLCLLLFNRTLADTPLTIVEQGQSQARIGVHPEADEWERHAASDLVRYIEEMSGARLPLIDQADALHQALAEATPLILVGRAALKAEPSLVPPPTSPAKTPARPAQRRHHRPASRQPHLLSWDQRRIALLCRCRIAAPLGLPLVSTHRLRRQHPPAIHPVHRRPRRGLCPAL